MTNHAHANNPSVQVRCTSPGGYYPLNPLGPFAPSHVRERLGLLPTRFFQKRYVLTSRQLGGHWVVLGTTGMEAQSTQPHTSVKIKNFFGLAIVIELSYILMLRLF